MFRLAGMLVGSVTMTLLLLLVLGLPDGAGLVQRLEDASPRLAKGIRGARALVAESLNAQTAPPAPSAAPPTRTAPSDRATTAGVAATPPEAPSVPPGEVAVEAPPEAVAAEPIPPLEGEASGTGSEGAADLHADAAAQTGEAWHAVWVPFYSERSARGFADRLARTTGLDYRVGRTTAGRYRVSVAYRGEAERQARLEAIARATGLSMEALQP